MYKRQVQYIELNNTKFLFANDRRNGRLWVKVKSKKINDISKGLKYFSKLRKKNIIVFPDTNLLNTFVEEKINEKLINHKLKYPIHFPNYLFKINLIITL